MLGEASFESGPYGASGKESTCQCRRCKRRGLDPWDGTIPWRRKWQFTPVFLPEKSHEQRSLVGYSPWGHKEADLTKHARPPKAKLIFIRLTFIAEKALAPHSSTLAWRIPWTEEPSGLQSMGSLRVRHDWTTSLSLFTFVHWRRKWQFTPVFLPEKSHGQRSLVGYSPWGHKESNTTDLTEH